MRIFYSTGLHNAGDYFSEWIIKKLGFDPVFSEDSELAITGSILAWRPYTHTKIWGLGFQNATERNNKLPLMNVCAVRGKLSADIIGLHDCVTGDPGILASRFYKPKTNKKKYKFGIIPHYVDYDWVCSLNLENVKIINILTLEFEKLFDEINECEFIFSSSLHGIIFSHSFGIPAFHFKHNELCSKNSFKFLDYYSNFNLKYLTKDIRTKEDFDFTEMEILYKNRNLFVPSADEITKNQNDLLTVFPFRKK